jgi:glycosyltransferase involved in cell wall biosynthesis
MTTKPNEVSAQGPVREEEHAPAVSIIMPAYRAAAYIADALDSVFAQTFKSYEVIVVNDGSPDAAELERVLEPYMERIVYIRQENRGLSGARNTALRAARGRFIALLDADDIWLPNYLEAQTALMLADSSLDVLYPDAEVFGDAPEAGQRFMEMCPSTGDVTFESLVRQECNVMICAMARHETVLRVGLFDESLRSSEDFDLWLRIVKAGGRIAYHREVLVRYRKRRGSLSSDPVWMCRHILMVLEKAERNLELNREEREALLQATARFRAMQRFHEGKRAFFEGDAKGAIEGLEEANSYLRSRKISLMLMLMKFAPRLMLRAYDMRDRHVFGASTKY